MRIGLAIIYFADSRALTVTADTVKLLSETPARVIVLECASVSRRLPPTPQKYGFEQIRSCGQTNVRQAALDVLSDCDLVILVQEGLVIGQSAITIERERFEQNRSLQVSFGTSSLILDMETYLQIKSDKAPYRSLKEHGKKRGAHDSRYFTPCMLSIARGRGELPPFENFARRSEWAAAKIFADKLSDKRAIAEFSTDVFGLITNIPDRRDAVQQGLEAGEELFRFGQAFPRYEKLCRSDSRKLLLEQLMGILMFSRPLVRLKFVIGLLRAVRNNKSLRARLNRDIRDLA